MGLAVVKIVEVRGGWFGATGGDAVRSTEAGLLGRGRSSGGVRGDAHAHLENQKSRFTKSPAWLSEKTKTRRRV